MKIPFSNKVALAFPQFNDSSANDSNVSDYSYCICSHLYNFCNLILIKFSLIIIHLYVVAKYSTVGC